MQVYMGPLSCGFGHLASEARCVYKQRKERVGVKRVKKGCLVGWKPQKEKGCGSLWQQKGKWHLNWIMEDGEI